MDMRPHQIIRLVTMGQDEVLDAKTIWLCASCFTCTTRCPKGVDLCKIMEALRLIKSRIRNNVDIVQISKMTLEDIEELPQVALVSNLRKFTG